MMMDTTSAPCFASLGWHDSVERCRIFEAPPILSRQQARRVRKVASIRKKRSFILNFLMTIFLTTLLFHSIGNAFPQDTLHFRWLGTEVMGTDVSTAEWVRTLIPFKKKTVYSENDLKSKSWCYLVKEKMSSQDVRCSFLFVDGGRFYSMIEVIPENIKFHFREIPKKPKNVSIIFPKELEDLFDIYP